MRRTTMEALSIRAASPSRWARMRAALTPQEWRRAGLMFGFVALLHVVGFFILFVLVAPHDYNLGKSGAFGLGVGITAYTLGLRHAFDADHIGAIDNTTRKLMNEGQRPLSVGFFYWLGHSTILFAMAPPFAMGGRGLSGGLVRPMVSGSFLFLIGILTLIVLVSVVKVS